LWHSAGGSRQYSPDSSHPSPYNLPGVQYPRIEADSRVTLHFNAPNAQKVQVALVTSGSNSLQPLPYDMVKGGDGVWTYTSAPQSPGYHNYWMLVDGAVVLDPATNAFIGYGHRTEWGTAMPSTLLFSWTPPLESCG